MRHQCFFPRAENFPFPTIPFKLHQDTRCIPVIWNHIPERSQLPGQLSLRAQPLHQMWIWWKWVQNPAPYLCEEKNIAMVPVNRRYKPGPVKDKRMPKEQLATGITHRWQNQGTDVWRLNKKPGWASLGTGAQTCCCKGGRLVVRHIPEASHSSWGGQKLWS